MRLIHNPCHFTGFLGDYQDLGFQAKNGRFRVAVLTLVSVNRVYTPFTFTVLIVHNHSLQLMHKRARAGPNSVGRVCSFRPRPHRYAGTEEKGAAVLSKIALKARRDPWGPCHTLTAQTSVPKHVSA